VLGSRATPRATTPHISVDQRDSDAYSVWRAVGADGDHGGRAMLLDKDALRVGQAHGCI